MKTVLLFLGIPIGIGLLIWWHRKGSPSDGAIGPGAVSNNGVHTSNTTPSASAGEKLDTNDSPSGVATMTYRRAGSAVQEMFKNIRQMSFAGGSGKTETPPPVPQGPSPNWRPGFHG